MRRTATPKGLGLGSAWASSGTRRPGGQGAKNAGEAAEPFLVAGDGLVPRGRPTVHRGRPVHGPAARRRPDRRPAARPSARPAVFARGLGVPGGVPNRRADRAGSDDGDEEIDADERAASGGSSASCADRRVRECGRVVVDRQEQAPSCPAGDERVEVGAGGQVVAQGVGRQRRPRGIPAERPERSARLADPAPRSATPGWEPVRPIDPPRLDAGRAAVQAGRHHGQHRTGRRPPEPLRPARRTATRSRATARSARASGPRRPGSASARRTDPGRSLPIPECRGRSPG